MLMAVFSPIGEGFLRGQVGACRLPADVAQRLDPLFAKVVDRAKKVNPHLDDNIVLFLKEDESINAAAVGRRTIILNTGALSLPNDQLAGILTHEMGHISHKDTAVTIGNGVVALAFGAIQLLINLLNMLVSILSRFHSYYSYRHGVFAGGAAVCICFRPVSAILDVFGHSCHEIFRSETGIRADEFASTAVRAKAFRTC